MDKRWLGGLAVCFRLGGDQVRIFSHVLEPNPQLERVFWAGGKPLPPVSYGASTLLVGAPCNRGVESSRIVCELHDGLWTQHDARVAIAGRDVVRWIPEEGGGVAVLVAPDEQPASTARLSLLDLRTGLERVLDQAVQVPPWYAGRGLRGSNVGTGWIVEKSGLVRGFTRKQSVVIDVDGKVRFGTWPLAQIAWSEGSALARDRDRLWQTTDYGAHWVEVEGPPYDDRVEGTMECSQAGCLMGSSRNGTVLRIGWPTDPPIVREAGDTEPLTFPAKHADRPAPPSLPGLECMGLDGASPKGPVVPRAQPGAAVEAALAQLKRTMDREGDRPPEMGNEPPAESLGGHGFAADREINGNRASVAYFDRFDGPGSSVQIPQALRALVRYEVPTRGPMVPVSALFASKRLIDVLYTEDFDPARLVQHAAGSFAQWRGARPAAGARAYRIDGEFRPVLSPRTGHADGAILIDDDLRFWVGAGKIRPISIDAQSCRPFAGYVDGHGKLLVACPGDGGATAVTNAESGEVVFRAPPHFPPSLSPRAMSTIMEGVRLDFDVADTIAVAKDGTVGILRLPSGSEPASVDDPAWLLSDGSGPVELAPWSSVRLASSPECAKADDGVRALVQTSTAWVSLAASKGFRTAPGMRALVRWSRERVCLEAIELGFRGYLASSAPLHETTEVMLAARFVGQGAGAALVALTTATEYNEPVRCTLRAVDGP